MSKYIVSLTPMGKYFFGGDMTFKVGTNKKYNERYSSYIIHSNQFPQQTSLLGMMRYLLLSNASEVFDTVSKSIKNAKGACLVIGEHSFAVTNQYVSNDYAKLKSISPCFLEKTENGTDWTILLPAPKDYGYSVSFDSSVEANFNGRKFNAPLISGYNPKNREEPVFIGAPKPISTSEIFIEDIRIGIDKKYDGVTNKDDSSFFKQICYRLGAKEHNGKYRFVFEAEVDDTIDLSQSPYNNSIISLGGDCSQFVLKVRKEKFIASYPDIYNVDRKFDSDFKIVLLSDTFLLRSEVDNTLFTISETQPFRFLETNVNTKNYTVISETNIRSKKYYLYQKGSVFYCNSEQLENFKAVLNKGCFRQIGYNCYQIFKRQ